MNSCSCLIGFSYDFKILKLISSFVLLIIDIFSVIYFYFKIFRKRVYNRRTHAVQTAGNLVSAAAEFTSRVKNGKYNLNRRESGLSLNTRRNTSSVIFYGYRVILVYGNSYFLAISRQSLVNRVINNLIDKMVKSS